jgi:hypothetical protein
MYPYYSISVKGNWECYPITYWKRNRYSINAAILFNNQLYTLTCNYNILRSSNVKVQYLTVFKQNSWQEFDKCFVVTALLKGNSDTFQPNIHNLQHQTSVYICENSGFLWSMVKKIGRKVFKNVFSLTSQGSIKSKKRWISKPATSLYFLAPHETDVKLAS